MLSHPAEIPEVIDVFVIPNYDKLFRGCIDPYFGRAFKEIWTQHCFMFEKGKLNMFLQFISIFDIHFQFRLANFSLLESDSFISSSQQKKLS